eukprot:TRINITY_DN2196_c1_g1_i2.p1 TRINITY_DN2196_c1_g1~~TRINITY_DN2196_c1_g1_i2.p1  ORF type:complete len:993 (+),score=172.72 TRINITY_DN2196_c1_g1_i2:170-3148(+)
MLQTDTLAQTSNTRHKRRDPPDPTPNGVEDTEAGTTTSRTHSNDVTADNNNNTTVVTTSTSPPNNTTSPPTPANSAAATLAGPMAKKRRILGDSGNSFLTPMQRNLRSSGDSPSSRSSSPPTTTNTTLRDSTDGTSAGGTIDASLRYSQVARYLEDSSNGNADGTENPFSGLGSSTDSSFWKMLSEEDGGLQHSRNPLSDSSSNVGTNSSAFTGNAGAKHDSLSSTHNSLFVSQPLIRGASTLTGSRLMNELFASSQDPSTLLNASTDSASAGSGAGPLPSPSAVVGLRNSGSKLILPPPMPQLAQHPQHSHLAQLQNQFQPQHLQHPTEGNGTEEDGDEEEEEEEDEEMAAFTTARTIAGMQEPSRASQPGSILPPTREANSPLSDAQRLAFIKQESRASPSPIAAAGLTPFNPSLAAPSTLPPLTSTTPSPSATAGTSITTSRGKSPRGKGRPPGSTRATAAAAPSTASISSAPTSVPVSPTNPPSSLAQMSQQQQQQQELSPQQLQVHQQLQQYYQQTPPPIALAQLSNLDITMDNSLKALKFQQRKVLDAPLTAEATDKLVKAQMDLKKQIDSALAQLEYLNDHHILHAPDAYKVVKILETFQLHSRRLRIFLDEFYQYQSARPGQIIPPVAALAITRQPFPCTVKQSKSVDEIVEVQILTGSKVDIQGPTKVIAELINEDFNPVTKKKNAVPAIQNGEELLDESGVATFKRLTFPHGSRVKSVNMRFSLDVTINGQLVQLQSEASRPFIVMTNHGQRSTTEGKLLKKHTFYARSEISWYAFANAMQLHYLRATKQDPSKPTRPLSFKDIEYLHMTKFSGRGTVTQEDYDSFWGWFGTILYKIRNHQKHILPMWIKGLIYGFLSREDSDRLLQTPTAIPGSFLLRFSDRCAGQFVIVYATQGKGKGPEESGPKEIKHYLIQPEDIEKKSTLPDFLRDCDSLWYLLQVVRDADTGVVSLRPRNKDDVLSPFYTRERNSTLPNGYDTRQP